MPDVSCVDRKIQEVPRSPSVADLTEIWIRCFFKCHENLTRANLFFVQKFCGNIETKFVTISFTFDLSRPHLEKKKFMWFWWRSLYPKSLRAGKIHVICMTFKWFHHTFVFLSWAKKQFFAYLIEGTNYLNF